MLPKTKRRGSPAAGPKKLSVNNFLQTSRLWQLRRSTFICALHVAWCLLVFFFFFLHQMHLILDNTKENWSSTAGNAANWNKMAIFKVGHKSLLGTKNCHSLVCLGYNYTHFSCLCLVANRVLLWCHSRYCCCPLWLFCIFICSTETWTPCWAAISVGLLFFISDFLKENT